MATPYLSNTHKPILHIAETKNDGAPTIIDDYIDTRPWQRATFLIGVGQTDTTVDAKIQESDDGSSWSDVPDAAITQIAADGDNSEVEITVDLTPAARKRYLKCLITVGNGTNGAALAVWCLLWSFNAQGASEIGPKDLEERVPA